jgi:hypothetical protein
MIGGNPGISMIIGFAGGGGGGAPGGGGGGSTGRGGAGATPLLTLMVMIDPGIV